MKQIDIFGNEVDVETIIEKKQKKRLTIKEKFRQIHGFKEGFKCANCIYFWCDSHNNKNYYKCKKIGISNSNATDIRLKDIACNLFEGVKDDGKDR